MTTWRRTDGRLADGREIFLYGSSGAPFDPPVDKRPLTPVTRASEIRLDRLTGDSVAVAAHRQERTYQPPADQCPLCPSRDGRMTEVPVEDYEVAIFENQFPALAGVGRCEVVCFTPRHEGRFADLSPAQARLVVDAWADRTEALSRRREVEQVFCFENRGDEIGVTLAHPHGQIYAYPYLPPRTMRMRDAALAHHGRTGGVLADLILERELGDGRRIVVETPHWVGFVPYAARWPVEVHLYPRTRVPDLAALPEAARDDLAEVGPQLMARLDRLYDAPLPYVAAWHQAPLRGPARHLLGLHLQVFSVRRTATKLKFLAGSESAMDAFVTDVRPEDVARRLREVA